MSLRIHFDVFVKNLCVYVPMHFLTIFYNLDGHGQIGVRMDIKEILSRIGFVRNTKKLSAREVSLRIGMSPQYVTQLESGRIVLTVEKLLQILEVCEFPVERFFSPNIVDYNVDEELKGLIESLPENKKKNIIEFIKK